VTFHSFFCYFLPRVTSQTSTKRFWFFCFCRTLWFKMTFFKTSFVECQSGNISTNSVCRFQFLSFSLYDSHCTYCWCNVAESCIWPVIKAPHCARLQWSDRSLEMGRKREQLEPQSVLSHRAGHLQTSLQLVRRNYIQYGPLCFLSGTFHTTSHNKQHSGNYTILCWDKWEKSNSDNCALQLWWSITVHFGTGFFGQQNNSPSA